jgi:hypothetical protein
MIVDNVPIKEDQVQRFEEEESNFWLEKGKWLTTLLPML